MNSRSYTKSVVALSCATILGLVALTGFSQNTANPASETSPTAIEQSVDLARQTLDSGAARAKLDEFVRVSQQLKAA